MRFRLIFTILLGSTYCFINSQNDNANHQKYWYYKTRLNNDFVKVGLDSGESIPFNQRGAYVTDWYPGNVALMCGDGTSTVGYYIALLATEYYLLKENGQDATKTKHELFCALNTLNRLDYKAESLWKPGAEALNGFLIRDDIPSTFTSNPKYYQHFNYYSSSIWDNKNSRGFNSRFQVGANFLTSSWIAREKESHHDISMSQDQVYCILFGLSFVSKFVPTSETDNGNSFGYGSGETSLTNEARNIAKRIIDYVRDSKNLEGKSCGSKTSTGWNIVNPVTCDEVSTGNDAHSFAYALGEAECFILHPKLCESNGSKRTNIPASCAGKGYHNTYSKTLGFQLWNSAAKSLIYLPSNSHYGADTRGQDAMMATICNCVYGTIADLAMQKVVAGARNVKGINWAGQVVNFAWQGVSTIFSTFIPGVYFNQSRSAINLNSYVNGTGKQSNPLGDPGGPLDHLPLARKILHGGDYNPNRKYKFKYLLDVAPCDNIYNLNNLHYGHYEWSSDSRLDRPDRRGWYGKNYDTDNPFNPQRWRPPSGEYNAIDYMLSHNLWYIYRRQKGDKPNMIDLSEVYVNRATLVNSDIGAFETITAADLRLESPSEVNWRAGKIIYLKPGTEIGGNFHAYIERFNCATDIGLPGEEGQDMNLSPHDTAEVKNPDFSDDDLLIVPNPSSGIFEVFYYVEVNESIYFEVLDMQGNIVLSLPEAKRVDTGLIIDLGGQAGGIYVLKGFTTLGRVMTKKLVKL